MKSKWIEIPQKKSKATFRLFCFPYAGGSSVIFHNWSQALPECIELCNIQLPGRDKSWKETPHSQLAPVVRELIKEMKPLLDLPYAFFGHSLGGIICFELARMFRKHGLNGPRKILISGAKAPQDESYEPPIHLLPQEEFIEVLRKYNGIPQEIIDNNAAMQLFYPRLRADFAILETYRYTAEPPLGCPIVAFGGSEDNIVPQESLVRWAKQTEDKFSIHFFKGDHFFIHSAREILLETIEFELQLYL